MSSRQTSVGLTLPQRGTLFGVANWDEMLALARAADHDEIFDSVWVGDSVMAKPRPESLSLLGALSSATSRVRLGVGCMASFALREPILFAEQWATLDFISNGRMQLAVCTGIGLGGTSAKEGAIWGVPDSERGERMSENITICRRLWSEEHVSFAGSFRSSRDATAAASHASRRRDSSIILGFDYEAGLGEALFEDIAGPNSTTCAGPGTCSARPRRTELTPSAHLRSRAGHLWITDRSEIRLDGDRQRVNQMRGERTSRRFIEFFTARIRNRNTRAR